MKKFLPLLVLVPYLFIAGKTNSSRFATSGDMVAAFLATMQKNDTVHYLEMYPTKEEAMRALLIIPDQTMGQTSPSEHIPSYYANKRAKATQMFEGARKKVTDEGISWQDLYVVSAEVKHMKGNFYVSDSLYEIIVNLSTGKRNITMRLQETMLTSAGWNCGMVLRLRVLPAEGNEDMRRKMVMDSMRMADSVYRAVMLVKFMADSTHMADSLAKREQMMRNKNNPK